VTSVSESPAATVPAEVTVTLTVNGEERSAQAEPRTLLVQFLRNQLGLSGTHVGCQTGQCGACTVLLDGEAVKSCMVLAVQAEGHEVTTIEGLADGAELHPIQQAFIDNDAQQCGFCTPGFVVASKALLDKHPHPTPEQIHKELAGNFCRCGTYAGIRAAVSSRREA